MLPLLMLLLLATPPAEQTAGGTIEATVRGPNEPLAVELLLRNASEEWEEVEHRNLAAGATRIRFDGLASGIYQIRIKGSQPTQQLGTKVAVGATDTRRITIDIEPRIATGRVLFGGTHLGSGAVLLRHREFGWRAGIAIAGDGTFRAPLWQRGTFAIEVRGPALATAFMETIELDGRSVDIAIPDGRITGIVRDAKSGAPIGGALVALQTTIDQREEHVQVTSDAGGRFDFAGVKYGRQTVRIFPAQHLEPEPFKFALDANARLRELDVRLESGRAVAVVVIDKENDPVANAQVFVVADAKLRSRTKTDADGRASVAVPAGESATLFVVPEEGPFGMQRIARESENGRLRIYVPQAPSSLLIRAQTTTGATLPPFSLLMRFNGELLPVEVAEELGVQLMTDANSEALLANIPSGSYEFWPYRTESEVASIIAAATALVAPIQVQVKTGENKIAVKFAAKVAARR
jgi:carboxypeptidase family protein